MVYISIRVKEYFCIHDVIHHPFRIILNICRLGGLAGLLELSYKNPVSYSGSADRVNPFLPKSDIDFSLANARRFYPSVGDPLGIKGSSKKMYDFVRLQIVES